MKCEVCEAEVVKVWKKVICPYCDNPITLWAEVPHGLIGGGVWLCENCEKWSWDEEVRKVFE